MSKAKEKKQFGKKLLELRKSHGYTQAFIAANIGVAQPTYYQYESGKRQPGPETIYRLASFYGLSTDELLKILIKLDEEIFYDASSPTGRALQESEFISFSKFPKYAECTSEEKRLLFYFNKMTPSDKNEILEFARFKTSCKNHPDMKFF